MAKLKFGKPNRSQQQKPVTQAPAQKVVPMQQIEPETEISVVETPAPQKTTAPKVDTKAIQQKAQAAAAKATKETAYDEDRAYTGKVIEEKPKGNIRIYMLDGPHGQVQAYSNAMDKATRDAIKIGAVVNFTPCLQEGGYYTAVNVSVIGIDRATSIVEGLQEKYAGSTFVTEEEVYALVEKNPEIKDVDAAALEVEAHFNGELVAGISTGRVSGFVLWAKS